MDSSGGRDGLGTPVLRGVALLVIVIGMLTVGTLGPEAFSPGTVASAIGAVVVASRSASLAPLLAFGLLVGGLVLAVWAEFGPFGSIDSTGTPVTVTCRICDHSISTDRDECPYCHTADPAEE